MAADIIVHSPDYVLVGDDQRQHMELYKKLAERYGVEKIAEPIYSETPRIMSIKDPTKKMSKSLGDANCIYIDDDAETIEKKIAKAPTTTEGIENLKQIAKGLGWHAGIIAESDMASSKRKLAQIIIDEFTKS
jgi:tryptophanyl-tRNA synthetase